MVCPNLDLFRLSQVILTCCRAISCLSWQDISVACSEQGEHADPVCRVWVLHDHGALSALCITVRLNLHTCPIFGTPSPQDFSGKVSKMARNGDSLAHKIWEGTWYWYANLSSLTLSLQYSNPFAKGSGGSLRDEFCFFIFIRLLLRGSAEQAKRRLLPHSERWPPQKRPQDGAQNKCSIREWP